MARTHKEVHGAAKKLIWAVLGVARPNPAMNFVRAKCRKEWHAVVGRGKWKELSKAGRGDLKVLPAASGTAFLYPRSGRRELGRSRRCEYIKIAERVRSSVQLLH